MAETAAGQSTEANQPTAPSPVGFPEGRPELSLALAPVPRKNWGLGLSLLCHRPRGEEGAGRRLPVCAPGGVAGPPAPGSHPALRGPSTLTAAPVGQACQLLCGEGRWSCGVFHPAGLPAFHAAEPTAGQALFGGREENPSPSLLVFREPCPVLSRPRGWAATSLPGHDLGQTTVTSLTVAARGSSATCSPWPPSRPQQHLSLLRSCHQMSLSSGGLCRNLHFVYIFFSSGLF